MDRRLNFKPLTPGQIEVRVTDTKTKGRCTLLLYIDSRAAADILNDTVGEYNWTIEYKSVGGTIYGRLSVWDEEKGMWIFREDTGEESNISASKGMSSDILKRCLARFGCDWLYRTPRIKITCPDNYYYNDKLTMSFSVRDIAWNEKKECERLVVVDRFGNVVYSLGDEKNEPRSIQMTVCKNNLEILRDFCTERKTEEGVDLKELKKFFDYYSRIANEWTNEMKPGVLWEKWLKTKR